MKKVIIYTDGSCLGNPGRGGWAAILCLVGSTARRELVGGARLTTNNRMELTAVIEALKALKKECDITLYTDSRYVMDGVTKWLPNWKKNNWRTSNKKSEVKNIDLWQTLDSLLGRHQIQWIWVKGHAGHPENERVDTLAAPSLSLSSLNLPQTPTMHTPLLPKKECHLQRSAATSGHPDQNQPSPLFRYGNNGDK